jgi:2-methylcitrate dehydratase PrpD
MIPNPIGMEHSDNDQLAMDSRPALTMALADWIHSLKIENVPLSVIHQVKRVVLDYHCAVIAGCSAPTSRAVQNYFAQSESGSAAGVVGSKHRFAAHTAAFINGTAAHGLEIDDGYTAGSYHPGACALPAIMAQAQASKSSAQEVTLAVVAAYEVSCRLARAGHPYTWQNGFHNTGINGVFASAVGVGQLLGLSVQELSWTLGMAGSFASGLFEFLAQGSETKRLHPGKSARDGVIVAHLARAGVDGPLTGIEGENGYFKAYAGGKADLQSVLQGLGTTYEMLNTYVKPYPCCRHLHAPIDAVLALKIQSSFDVSDVVRVVVQTHRGAAKHDHQHYDGLLDAQMSIPYAVAAALVYDQVDLMAFGSQARANPDMARLAASVSVEVSETIQAVYPAKRSASVTLVLRDGRCLTHLQPQPYGEPDNPLDDAALTQKFHAICDPVIGHGLAQAIVRACWSLDLEAIDRLTTSQTGDWKCLAE